MLTFPVGTILFLAAALATYLGVLRFRLWAERRNMVDLPNERSSHTRPIPRGGGLILVAVTLVCASLWAAVGSSSLLWSAFLFYLGGALLVAAVSWMDDLRSLPGSARLAVHFLGAGVAICGLGYWRIVELPLWGTVHLGWWGAAITALWIVGLTNAYNFMDGTDGIAGGQALVAGLGWALLGWNAGTPLIAVLGLLVAGGSLGFLLHNWAPARIFMGDIGSAFLGYTLAVLPVMLVFFIKDSRGAPAVGLLLVWPFVFDTAFTFLRRLWHGEHVFAAHRSHLYQRMTSAVSGHARVALIYSGLALAGALLAQVWSTRVVRGDVGCLLAVPVLCFGLWILARMHEQQRADRTRSRLADPESIEG